MKKLLTLLLTFVLALVTFAGCGQKESDAASADAEQKEETTENTEGKKEDAIYRTLDEIKDRKSVV